MYLFWTLWAIDALITFTLIFFFFIGLGDGTVSPGNLALWLISLTGVVAVLFVSYWLFTDQYTGIAKLLLALLAVLSVLYGLLMLLMFSGGNSSG